jgi:hypothetical protein
MRDYQNNEQSDLAAIIRFFSPKSCAFEQWPLAGPIQKHRSFLVLKRCLPNLNSGFFIR